MWPSGLRRCSKNRKVPCSNPTRRSAGLRDPTSLRGSWWPLGRKCNTQWLTSGEWGCPIDNGPKLALGQPNSSLKKKKTHIRRFFILYRSYFYISAKCGRAWVHSSLHANSHHQIVFAKFDLKICCLKINLFINLTKCIHGIINMEMLLRSAMHSHLSIGNKHFLKALSIRRFLFLIKRLWMLWAIIFPME